VKAIRPFMQMSEVNRLLSRDLRDRQADSATFLLLEKLFDREWLKNIPLGEKALVGEIAANAETLREFISKDAKMVDLKIQPYLSRVSAHYRILELAYEGNLGEDGKPFVERYVFPRQIDEVLALEVSRLWNSIPFDRARGCGGPVLKVARSPVVRGQPAIAKTWSFRSTLRQRSNSSGAVANGYDPYHRRGGPSARRRWRLLRAWSLWRSRVGWRPWLGYSRSRVVMAVRRPRRHWQDLADRYKSAEQASN
jgi:hypothetical protein